MRIVLKPWNPMAEVREYFTAKDDIVATHVVIARGKENGVRCEHHYLTNEARAEEVMKVAKLYPHWKVQYVSLTTYVVNHHATCTTEEGE